MLNDLVAGCGEWLKGIGKDSDIVMSSRIRLARNLADYPFIRRCNDIDRANIESSVRMRLIESGGFGEMSFFDIADLEHIDRQFLVERQLISRELADSDGARSVAIDRTEQVSLMINEEDHLRIQSINSGFDLLGAWEKINEVDDRIESQVTYAFHPSLGYLTACPTNVGTGMRVSVLVHLPALVLTRQIEKVFRGLQRINLAVRGLYGEGSQAMGDFYQVSNQITLGKTEADLIKQVGDVVPALIQYERKARAMLVRENGDELRRDVDQALSSLRNAERISSQETMQLLSKLRMGIILEIIKGVEIPLVNKLFIHIQPAHLQKLRGAELNQEGRNFARAVYLRSHLKSNSDQTDVAPDN
jgi:protein arginine kinase